MRYEQGKRLVKKLLPEKLLASFEVQIRYAYSLLYLGNKVACHCCGGRFSQWITLERGEALCPRCGSLPRTRRLFDLLNDGPLESAGPVLHFSPGASMLRRLTKMKGEAYEPSDYLGEFRAKFSYDILNIGAPDEKYDVVICYHVLEHITDDLTAMKELYRVLAHEGICLIQTPFKDGDTYEDYSITEPEEREIAFGQNDHVRIYSPEGLAERLKSVGFKVAVNTYPANAYLGLRGGEKVFICTK